MAMGYRHWNGGLGVPKNCSKAVRFYEIAANKVLSCLWKRCRLSVFGVRCSVFGVRFSSRCSVFWCSVFRRTRHGAYSMA